MTPKCRHDWVLNVRGGSGLICRKCGLTPKQIVDKEKLS